MTPIEKKVADQIGAMTLELLKLQTMVEERDREIVELKARANIGAGTGATVTPPVNGASTH